jgi:hypothetical protein
LNDRRGRLRRACKQISGGTMLSARIHDIVQIRDADTSACMGKVLAFHKPPPCALCEEAICLLIANQVPAAVRANATPLDMQSVAKNDLSDSCSKACPSSGSSLKSNMNKSLHKMNALAHQKPQWLRRHTQGSTNAPTQISRLCSLATAAASRYVSHLEFR